VLYAVSPEKPYWNLEKSGRVRVADDGSNVWEEGKESDQAYLKVHQSPQEIAKIIDALMVGIYSENF
jgi:purine nucleosidase